MRNVRLLVPDQLHAKMHSLASLAGVSVSAAYMILAALMIDQWADDALVVKLYTHAKQVAFDDVPAVVQVPSPVEA